MKHPTVTIHIGIHYGHLVAPIGRQLREQGYTIDKSTLSAVQADADAIAGLSLRNILTEGETRKARQRLTKRIAKLVSPVKKRGARERCS